ncbi:MAG: gluconokinase [Chloroflexota bacterium]|nr:gluconokinase [Chloroflexota bacterium]
MKRDLILGVDLGTTACKAIVVSPEGRELGSGSATYPLYTPNPSWAEQDPEEVWEGMVEAVREALASLDDPTAVRALSFSTAMHGVLAVDEEGAPLTRCLIWADQRSTSQVEMIRQQADAHGLYQRTGCPVQPIFLPAKILWLRQERPQVYRRVYKYISVKDYVLHRLTGRYLVDKSTASATGLMDTHKLDWDDEILKLVGIDRDQLPQLVSPEAVLEGIVPQWARELGLSPEMAIVPGAGDGGLANLGVGAVEEGQVASTIGTSGAVRMVTRKPYLDPQERTWCYLLTDGRWFAGGAISSGGLIYDWFRDRFFKRDEVDYEELEGYAEEVGLGAEGLLFLPYLAGERNPHWNAQARGVLFGLSLHHGRKHIARATMEGVAFCMYDILLALEGALGGIKEIRATGGFTRSPLWVQILSDVYGHPVATLRARASSGMGAVFLAMKALGYIEELAEVREFVPIQRIYEPDMEHHRRYRELHGLFQRLYRDVEENFDVLHKLSTGDET